MSRTRKPLPTPNTTNVEKLRAPESASINVEDRDKVAKSDRQEYIDLRKHLMDGEQKSYESFDKAILTLASTAFGFSLALVQFLASTRYETWLLLFAWGFFIGSLIAVLISFLSSQHAFRHQIAVLDQRYGGPSVDGKNIPDILTGFLNWLSAGLFVTGAIFLAFFVYYNLPA